jgi:hypothetical protein
MLDEAAMGAAIDGIVGYASPREAMALYGAVVNAPAGADGAVVVEIGAYGGRSTIPLALGVQERGRGYVVTIDPMPQPSMPANLARAGVSPVVRHVGMGSHAARVALGDLDVSVLYVDGSHAYEDVQADAQDWLPLVRNGGVAAFNDPSWPGVYRVLREQVLVAGSRFRRPTLVDNTVFFTACAEPWTAEDGRALRRMVSVLAIRYRLALYRHRHPVPAWAVRAARSVLERAAK